MCSFTTLLIFSGCFFLFERKPQATEKKEKATGKRQKNEELNTANAELNATMGEINELESSTQWYDVKVSSDLREGSNGTSVIGEVTFDEKSSIFTIHLLQRQDLEQAANELKYAYQFEVGELGFSSNREKSLRFSLR